MDKIAKINIVLEDYFKRNPSGGIILAKDFMPLFISAGIFPADRQNGLPIRRILRQLDETKELHRIPYTIAERKAQNTNWYFGRISNTPEKTVTESKTIKGISKREAKKSGKRQERDEHYIIDLCDEILGITGSRQHRFPFLVGDSGVKLPVDVYYEQLNLVIEYNEQQHTKAVKHFDKPDKLTVSGVHRGEQRKIYDQRKRVLLPEHGIRVITIPHEVFNCNSRGKIIRDRDVDRGIVKQILKNNQL